MYAIKKIISIILIVFLILLSVVGCKDNNSIQKNVQGTRTQQGDASNTSKDLKNDKVSQQATIVDEEFLQQIELTYGEDPPFNDRQIITVWAENKSNKIFTGDVHITFKDGQNKIIGSDMIIIEDLKPNSKTYAKLSVKPSRIIEMSYSFAKGYSFVEDNIGKEGTVDEALTESLTQYMYESFGGFGRKEFAASWYEYLIELKVYRDDEVYYAIVIAGTKDEAIVERIAMTVLANFKEVELSKVIVKDKNDNILTERSK